MIEAGWSDVEDGLLAEDDEEKEQAGEAGGGC